MDRQIVTIMDLTSGAQNNLLNFIRDNKLLCCTNIFAVCVLVCVRVNLEKKKIIIIEAGGEGNTWRNDKILQLFLMRSLCTYLYVCLCLKKFFFSILNCYHYCVLKTCNL